MATSTIHKSIWKAVVASPITANGTYPSAVDLNSIENVRVALMVSGTFRQTAIFSIAEVKANLAFPDFQFAGTVRNYCAVKISGNNIVISDLSIGLAGSSFVITGC